MLHVDLHEVDLAVEIEAPVAIELVGTPAGVIDGGVLDWEHREVVVRALPADVPAVLELDVSGLQIGHHLSVGVLSAPAGVTILDDPETMIVARRSRRGSRRHRLWLRLEEASAEPEESRRR